MDSDGWFHTGDIGILTPEGALKIVDRKKNIFKLSQGAFSPFSLFGFCSLARRAGEEGGGNQKTPPRSLIAPPPFYARKKTRDHPPGEYIAVEKLEATFKKAPLVEQVWVYGSSFKSQLVAVVVPTAPSLRQFAKENGLDPALPASQLCKDPRCAAWALAELAAVGKADKLKGFEMVKAVHVEPEAFSVEADLMTPSFKLKRPQLQKRYQPEIDAMYKALPQ
jgi:long-chain acyl-CoA synthetase